MAFGLLNNLTPSSSEEQAIIIAALQRYLASLKDKGLLNPAANDVVATNQILEIVQRNRQPAWVAQATAKAR